MTNKTRQLLPQSLPCEMQAFCNEDEEFAYWLCHDSAVVMAEMDDVSDLPPATLKTGPGRQGSRAQKRPAVKERE